MRIFITFFVLAIGFINTSLAEDEGGQNPEASEKSGGHVSTSKLPVVSADTVLAPPRRATQKLVRVPKNLVRGLKEAMEAVREKQETLIGHLECSVSSSAPEACDKLPLPDRVRLDWTAYVSDDQTPYLLEISHFFKENPSDLPIEIVTPIMQMFNGAVTEVYIKQRYISSLFEQAVCSISGVCERPNTTKKPFLKEEDRVIPNVYEWITNLFQPFQPWRPSFSPPTFFAGQKPCRNETLSGSFNNGTGFYYSSVVEYGTNCTQFQHNSSAVHH